MQAGVLADLLEHLNMTPAVLFGTSNGGRLSLYFAASYPDLCAGVIVNNLTSGQLAAQCLSRKCGKRRRPRAPRARRPHRPAPHCPAA